MTSVEATQNDETIAKMLQEEERQASYRRHVQAHEAVQRQHAAAASARQYPVVPPPQAHAHPSPQSPPPQYSSPPPANPVSQEFRPDEAQQNQSFNQSQGNVQRAPSNPVMAEFRPEEAQQQQQPSSPVQPQMQSTSSSQVYYTSQQQQPQVYYASQQQPQVVYTSQQQQPHVVYTSSQQQPIVVQQSHGQQPIVVHVVHTPTQVDQGGPSFRPGTQVASPQQAPTYTSTTSHTTHTARTTHGHGTSDEDLAITLQQMEIEQSVRQHRRSSRQREMPDRRPEENKSSGCGGDCLVM